MSILLDVRNFKVGDSAVMLKSSGFSLGVYTCTKVNKTRIEMTRNGDTYKKYFSAKTGNELGEFSDKYMSFITIAEAERRKAHSKYAADLRQAFVNVEQAAHNRNMEKLEEAYEALKNMMNKNDQSGIVTE